MEGAGALALMILFDSDEDEINDPEIWEKITVNVDEFLQMSNGAFKLHFRMSTEIFELLLHDIAVHLNDDDRYHRDPEYNLSHILLMVLWIFATPDTFRSIALRFGKTPGVLHHHYVRIVDALVEMSETYVKWPSIDERGVTSRAVQRRTGFPGVVGAIDGCHINIVTPRADPGPFFNRHHNHSIVLQAVADETLQFRDIYVGQPGSVHDSRVFRRSPISTLLLEEPQRYLSNDQHILGDGAYILTNKVLTPFRNLGNLTDEQTNYNIRHASARSVVERAFGLLKNKWRRLHYLTSWNLQYGVSTIVACICVHNFVLNGGEDYNVELNQRDDEQPELVPDDGMALDFHHPDVQAVERDHPLLANARQLGVEYRWDMVWRLPQQVISRR